MPLHRTLAAYGVDLAASAQLAPQRLGPTGWRMNSASHGYVLTQHTKNEPVGIDCGVLWHARGRRQPNRSDDCVQA